METEKEMQSLNDTTATWPEMDVDPFKGCRGVRRLLFRHMNAYDIIRHIDTCSRKENNITQLYNKWGFHGFVARLIIDNIYLKLTHQELVHTSFCVCFFPMNVIVLGRFLRAKEGQPLEIGAQFSLGLVHWRQFVHESPKVSEVEHIWKSRCPWRSSMGLYFR